MEKGVSRRHKAVPKSAALHHSFPPAEKKSKKRQAASATTQRVTIQPPVCRVQPGKVLELRTSIGLLRAKALLQQQHADITDQESVQKAAMTRGQLKHGHLQPLGVVGNRIVDPDNCMGIIPVHSRTRSRQRPKSSGSGVHFDLPNDDEADLERKGRSRAKRRSYSAVLSRTVNTEHLYHLLSISRHTALVPKNDESDDTVAPIYTGDNDKSTAEDDDRLNVTITDKPETEKAKILPPVVRHGELGMRIEVKGLKANESPHGSPSRSSASPRGKRVDSPRAKQTSSKTKLPPITNSPSEKNNKKMSESVTFTSNSESKQDQQDRKLSIVSIGEVSVAEDVNQRRNSNSKRKRHSSGKLSLGWSSPKPIEPLLGSPLHIPHAQSELSNDTDSGGPNVTEENSAVEIDLRQRTMSPNMISVNVNEFLLDAVDST